MNMKKKLLLAALTFTAAGPVYAADLPARMPVKMPPIPTAASSWTGLYIGLGLGPRASRTDVISTSATLAVGPAFSPVPIDLSGLATREPLDGTAFRAAPYVGLNWQIAPQWVVGIEGDAGFANQTTTLAGFPFGPGVLPTGLAGDSLAIKTTWDASTRGRLGFLIMPTTLVYATGGAAWQRYEVTSTCGSRLFCLLDRVTSPVIAGAVTKTGWTIGGGFETALWGNWFVRGEYRYADFGTSSFFQTRTASAFGGGPSFMITDNFNVAVRTHTATFGLAYKFGDPVVANNSRGLLGAFPVKALPARSPAAVTSWDGLYVGLGLGLRTSRTDATTTLESLVGFPALQTDSAASEPLDGIAFRAAPYVGFNWQVAPRWVIGVEGDDGFANQTTTLAGFPGSPALGISASSVASADGLAVKTTWDASVRGRFGFLLTPATLAYATGGAAWQHYDVTSTCVDLCAGNNANPAVITNSATKAGWTIGGGIEAALWSNWFARVDYRYADFGSSSFNLNRIMNGVSPLIDTFNLALLTHTVTFGLAYKFDWTGAPRAAHARLSGE